MNDLEHSQAILTDIAVVIMVAVLFGLGLMRMKQPPLVGFILAGVLMGPTGLGLISSSQNITTLAELGVLMLLFFIGTEISLKAFVYSIRQAVPVAAGQLLAALAIGLAISAISGASVAEGIILAFIIAISSTVVAMKVLDNLGVLRGEPGRIAVGVLIAQDIAVVPMLIIIGALGGETVSMAGLMFKVLVAVGILGFLLWWLGRRGKLKIPFAAAIENNTEILALGSLGWCFAAAALSGAVGLSPVYGAFVAGLIVGNSTLRNSVVPVIEPVQSVLLVAFFLSIGLLIDLAFVWSNLALVCAASLAVIAAKTLLNVFLLRITGASRDDALFAGLSMAQIGEFSFVLAAAGLASGALGGDLYLLAITVTAVSLIVSPAWMSVMKRMDEIATEAYPNYRAALAEAYSTELEQVERGRTALGMAAHRARVRLRVARAAIARRRAAAAETEEQSIEPTGTEEPASDTEPGSSEDGTVGADQPPAPEATNGSGRAGEIDSPQR